ncbi:chitinase [Microbacterium sp. USHLN186]|uniref:chitinase n=1 Tax=Microbacterium sp. USHLN186 TaxID=3081286 RepID=UPI003019CD6A
MSPSTRHPGKRLSPWRVLVGVLVLALTIGAAAGVPWYLSSTRPEVQTPAGPRWFGGYFDVTAVHGAAATTVDESVNGTVLLSFVVAEDAESCLPTWGSAYDLTAAGRELDLDRRVDRMRRAGAHVAVSFGGALNTELASACENVASLQIAYAAVLDRYGVSTMDLDLEAGNLSDRAAGVRRAEAIARLQAARERTGDRLDVWVTLPVALDGLTADGIEAVRILIDGGVSIAGVNAMTMDYGTDLGGRSMSAASIDALEAVHDQLTRVYADRGLDLPGGSAWSLIGATPMIGQNDVRDEVFTLRDAERLNAFAQQNRMARLSMWSINRDRTCGQNYPDVTVVSDACSGVDQNERTFAGALAAGFRGAPAVQTAEPEAARPVRDDSETSPYPIWSPDAGYSSGVRVVWHGYVYAAKWWVLGGPEPDDPTPGPDQTSWVLVGPVMPDDEPFALPTAAAGTYPEWKAATVYQKGARVLYQGTPFQAKWWTQGELPSDGVLDHDRSPWQVVEEDDAKP